MQISIRFDELTIEDQAKVWVIPNVYNAICSGEKQILTGKKGSGKTTLVSRLQSDQRFDSLAAIVSSPTLVKVLDSFSAEVFEKKDPRVVESEISGMLETSYLMILLARLPEEQTSSLSVGARHVAEVRRYIDRIDARSRKNQDSSLRRALRIKLDLPMRASLLLQTVKPEGDAELWPEFQFQDEALEILAQHDPNLLICLDEIDDVTLPYSLEDVIIINALLASVINFNKRLLSVNLKSRVLLSIPQELYEHTHLFGQDKVAQITDHVRWTERANIELLMSKSLQFAAIKANRGSPATISASWARCFPRQVTNMKQRDEDSLDYLLRHTQYTPRQATELLDDIIQAYEADGKKSFADLTSTRTYTPPDQYEWSRAFVRGVAEGTAKLVHNELSVWQTLYPNIGDVLAIFSERPFVWRREKLLRFLSLSRIALERKNSNGSTRVLGVQDVLEVLHRIGFLGIGFRERSSEPPAPNYVSGPQHYRVEYSFLISTKAGNWDLGCVAPMYVSKYRMWMPDWVHNDPLHTLKLHRDIVEFINSYEPEVNLGTYRNKTAAPPSAVP